MAPTRTGQALGGDCAWILNACMPLRLLNRPEDGHVLALWTCLRRHYMQ